MINIKLENMKGDYLEINQNSPFSIVDIQGLSPTSAMINMSETSLMDGGKFNSSKINSKQIIVAFSINKDAAKNRIEIYKILKTKQFIKFYYHGYYRDVCIEGYIDSIDITHFEMKQVATVSFLCPSPFFKEAQEIVNDIDNLVGMLVFPFAITKEEPAPFSYVDKLASLTFTNDGDVSCGMMLELYSRSLVKNPKIFDYITTQWIGLDIVMQTGDVIYINTNQGQKTITLLRNGEYENIFNCLTRGSKWLQLETGENTYTYEAEKGMENLEVRFIHSNLYEGV